MLLSRYKRFARLKQASNRASGDGAPAFDVRRLRKKAAEVLLYLGTLERAELADEWEWDEAAGWETAVVTVDGDSAERVVWGSEAQAQSLVRRLTGEGISGLASIL